MENRAHALAAGLFLLFLGLATASALWWFGSDHDQVARYVLVSEGNITGLNEQAQVRYRGIRAGKVEAIEIDPADLRHILVRINVRRNFPVTRGTRASLGYLGLTGIAFVDLSDKGDDPTPLPPGPGGLPRLALHGGMMEQLSDVGMDTMRKFQVVADRLGKALDDENLAHLSRSLEHVESASGGLDRTLQEAVPLLASLRATFSPENVARINQTLARLDAASQQAAPTLEEFKNLAIKLNGLSERLDRLAGSAEKGGTVTRLDGLLQELTETSRHLNKVLEEVEAAPQVLVFGRGQSAPGPGETGFRAPGKTPGKKE